MTKTARLVGLFAILSILTPINVFVSFLQTFRWLEKDRDTVTNQEIADWANVNSSLMFLSRGSTITDINVTAMEELKIAHYHALLLEQTFSTMTSSNRIALHRGGYYSYTISWAALLLSVVLIPSLALMYAFCRRLFQKSIKKKKKSKRQKYRERIIIALKPCQKILSNTTNTKDQSNCPICLAQLDNGEIISQSSNPNCIHIFHEACIATWLLKQNRRQVRNSTTTTSTSCDAIKYDCCPCCRQPFLHTGQGIAS